ncbi:MAG TPA: DUF6766 family protein [Acidimicrobiales bacterium]|nr:DUF6766 family protein [Acidimicrobiales bacterium]
MAKHLRRWGAAYILLLLFLGSWLGQLITQLIEVGNEAREHGQPFQMSDFWPQFWQATFENWQSEWLQLFVQAVVLLGMKHILFKADAEDMERLEAKVDALLESQQIDVRAIEERAEREHASSNG